MMEEFTDSYINNSKKEPKIKFLSYSTHDWTVAQMLLFFFDAKDHKNFEVLPYASSFKLELHSSKECKSEECFWVEVIYNGNQLTFDGMCDDESRCTYPEFI